MPTTIRSPLSRLAIAAAALASLAVGTSACNDTATTAVVENAFPARPPSDGGGRAAGGMAVYVYKVWWITTLFASPVAPGQASETERTVPGNDYAYALLAPGWSPADGRAPAHLIAARSAHELSVATHGTLHLVVSDDTFIGDCAAGQPLSPADAQLVVERIFPGALAGTYDPATCTVSLPDGGATEAGADAVTTDADAGD